MPSIEASSPLARCSRNGPMGPLVLTEARTTASSAGRQRWAAGFAPAGGAMQRVRRTALENAVSVASLLLLTEATLTEVPEPAKPATPAREAAYEGGEFWPRPVACCG
jgi:hypothetical protein